MSLLYRAAEGGKLVSEEFTSNFSSYWRWTAPVREALTELAIMPTGAYFDPKPNSYGSGVVGMELHLTAQPSGGRIGNSNLRRMPTALFLKPGKVGEHAGGAYRTETGAPGDCARSHRYAGVAREIVAVYSDLGSPDIQEGKAVAPLRIQAIYLMETAELPLWERI